MTADIIDLAKWREEKENNQPHEVGWSTCQACRYRCVVVAPVARDQDRTMCPKCDKMEMEFE
jgi:hypothetical protein